MFDYVCLTVFGMVPVFLCVLFGYLTVFVVLERHIKDKVCAFWSRLELCGSFATEVVCEWSNDSLSC